MLGVILDLESLDHQDLDLTRLRVALDDWKIFASTNPDDTASRIENASIVVTNKVIIGKTELEAAKNLKLICVAATGTNNIDLEAARQRGVMVSNVRAYGTPSVVEHVFTGLLTLVRNLDAYRRDVASGAWENSTQFCLLNHSITEIAGKRLGIVGYGELGRGVARVAESFGMQVIIANRPGGTKQPDRVDLQELLPQIDVLSLHCPLTPDTRNLIGAEELSRLPPHAIVINTSRGGIVNEDALVNALKTGQISGAMVDVLTEEPPRNGNPLLKADLPNLIITPHIAWASVESRQRLIDQVAQNIEQYLQNTPQNLV